MHRVAKRRSKRQYVILPASTNRAGALQAPAARPLDEIALETYSKSRRELIAEAAYLRALGRGFRGGSAVEDWLAAEAEINAMLRSAERNQR